MKYFFGRFGDDMISLDSGAITLNHYSGTPTRLFVNVFGTITREEAGHLAKELQRFAEKGKFR